MKRFGRKKQDNSTKVDGIGVHTPDEQDLPLALRTGPAPYDGTDFRMAGGNILMVRPEVMIDPSTGDVGRGQTQRRIASFVLAGIEHDTGVPMSDVCDVNVVDHEGRIAVVRVRNHSAETTLDLAIPIHAVTAQMYEVMQTYRDGVLSMATEAHKKRQNLDHGRALLDQALARLEELKSDNIHHATPAEFMVLETCMRQARMHGTRIPYAEPSGENLSDTWLVRGEDQAEDGHQVIGRGQTRRPGIAVDLSAARRVAAEPQVSTYNE